MNRPIIVKGFPKEGYVKRIEENLIVQLTKKQISYYNAGSGGELRWKLRPCFEKGVMHVVPPKMWAKESSSALVVNTFAEAAAKKMNAEYWNSVFGIGILSGKVHKVTFEEQLPVVSVVGLPPNLDLYIRTGANVVAVESKFKEPCSKHKKPDITQQYFDGFIHNDELLKVAREIQTAKLNFKWLDAAQLVKHLMGLESLIHRKRSHIKNYQLIYLYHQCSDQCHYGEHAEEVAKFSNRIGRCGCLFKAMTYADVVGNLQKIPSEKEHVKKLLKHYSGLENK